MNAGTAIFLKSFAIIPALVSGFWFAQQRPKILFHVRDNSAALNSSIHAPSKPLGGGVEKDISELIIERKLRIEFLLNTLERVAEVAQQMAPERAAILEPTIADLMEQLIDLSSASAIAKPETDATLTQLESTVQRLLESLVSTVEPETSL